ncbi:hypothetical protein ACFFRR_007332 [Megaselia abdita]
MDDEYALCWNNFQETIATGFQDLYDKGDLVDVTLAVEGNLIHAHKIVLAICSPYFQKMFSSNPCKHPILILKDISFGVMCELVQFMYQGAVSVKQTELSTFMKIAQTLQIRGLTTNSNNTPQPTSTHTPSLPTEKQSSAEKSPNQSNSTPSQRSDNISESGSNSKTGIQNESNASQSSAVTNNIPQPKSSPESLKRLNEYSTESLSIYSKKQSRRNMDGGGSSGSSADDMQSDSMDQINQDDVFIPPIPQISMIEPRFDLNNVKREHSEQPNSPGPMRGCGPAQLPHSFSSFDYNAYSAAVKQHIEYPNDLHMPNDYSKSNFNNHMDIPPSGGNIVMLSSTSLLHGNCVFNRNNTVATQQGMKTYWLCKSYRITMCRARCITHQGKIISATGVHNHTPHMKPDGSAMGSGQGNEMLPPVQGMSQAKSNNSSAMNRQPTQHHPQILPPHHHHQSNQHLQQQPNSVIQNMMHNVNLMQMSMMPHSPGGSISAPLLNSSSVTAPMMSPSNIHSPSNPRSHQSSHSMDSPGMHQQPPSVGQIESSSNDGSNMADYHNSNNVDNSSSDQNYDGSMDLPSHSTFKMENM